jgi:hypothetical protein
MGAGVASWRRAPTSSSGSRTAADGHFDEVVQALVTDGPHQVYLGRAGLAGGPLPTLGRSALKIAQHEGQRHSSSSDPSRSMVRVSRHPYCALMSV